MPFDVRANVPCTNLDNARAYYHSEFGYSSRSCEMGIDVQSRLCKALPRCNSSYPPCLRRSSHGVEGTLLLIDDGCRTASLCPYGAYRPFRASKASFSGNRVRNVPTRV